MKTFIKSIDRGMFLSFVIFFSMTVGIDKLIHLDFSRGVYIDSFPKALAIMTFILFTGLSGMMFYWNVKEFIKNYKFYNK
jgi:hypothetical protein